MTTVSEMKAAVLEALVTAGAEVTLSQAPFTGSIRTINGYMPRWEIRGRPDHVLHVNVGHGRIGRGLKIIRPKQGRFDFVAIAQALIDDAAKQVREDAAKDKWAREAAESLKREEANATIAARVVTEQGGKPDLDGFGDGPSSYQRTQHVKLTATSWGIKIETTAQSEEEARAVVSTIELVMSRRHRESGAA